MKTKLAFLALLVLGASTAGQGTGPAVPAEVQPLGPTAIAEVYDATTGLPVAGARVFVEGTSVSAVTNADGRAEFFLAIGTPALRFFVEPDGYTLGLVEETTEAFPWAEIPVLPHAVYESASLVPPSAAYSEVFTGTIGGVLGDVPFWFEVSVPPGTFAAPYRIQLAPRPMWSRITSGLGGDPGPLGQWHVRVVDADGAEIELPVFPNPVTLRFRPWNKPNPRLYDPVSGQLAELVIHGFDYDERTFRARPETPYTIDPFAGTVSLELRSFSLWVVELALAIPLGYSAGKALGSGSTSPPVTPSADLDLLEIKKSFTCEFAAGGPLACGMSGFDYSFVQASGTTVVVSHGLRAALEMHFGASTSGAFDAAIGKLQGQTKTTFQLDSSGQLTSATTEEETFALAAGTMVAPPCGVGSIEIKRAVRTYEILFAGVSLGTVDKPAGMVATFAYVHSRACPGCSPLDRAAPPGSSGSYDGPCP